jgi:hypothetical protein
MKLAIPNPTQTILPGMPSRYFNLQELLYMRTIADPAKKHHIVLTKYICPGIKYGEYNTISKVTARKFQPIVGPRF